MVVQVGGDLYVSEEGLSALWAIARTVPGECPYPGLDAFGPGQAKWFFGREKLTGDLLDILDSSLRAEHGGPVAVVGSSGAGKSSLLGAGLVRALGEGRLAVTGSDAWPILAITPGARPLETLTATVNTCAAALTGRSADSPNAADGVEKPDSAQPAWESALRELRSTLRTSSAEGLPRRVVIVIDQFEELFTSDSGEAKGQAFLAALAAITAPAPDGPVGLVVLGMRADFYARATEYAVLRAALQTHQLVIGAMTQAELAQAISQPAHAAGLRLEGGLAERLIRDLGVGADGTGYEAGRLPLLAYALRATWQRRRGNRLTIAGYEATGGIGGAIARAAEDRYTGLDASGQQAARRLFLDLVQVGSGEPAGEGTPDTRRRIGRERLYSRASDPAAVRAVLDVFIAARLITSGGQTVEIAHDALLSRWPRLRDWIGQDRSGNLIHQSLEEAAAAWDRDGRESSALYGGIRLAEAHQWADDPAHPRDLSKVARDFLAASAGRRKRDIRLRNRIITMLTVLLVFAGCAVFAAVMSANTASRQAAIAARQHAIALSGQLAAESLTTDQSDPLTARQLAVAAWCVDPTSQADAAMGTLLAEQQQDGLLPATRITKFVYKVAFSPDGRLLASADSDGTIREWNPATGQATGPPITADTGGPIGSANGRVFPFGGVYGVAFSPDGRLLASADADGTVRLWNPVTGHAVGKPLPADTGPNGGVNDVAFSPDGRLLASADADGTVRLWNPATGQSVGAPLRVGSPVISVAFSPDGELLASADDDGTVRLWNPATGQPVRAPLHAGTGPGGGVIGVAFSPDGRLLASADNDGTVQLWNPATGHAIGAPIPAGNGPSYLGALGVAFSPDGRLLASADASGTVRLWNPATGQPVGATMTAATGPFGGVTELAFSPDGRLLASVDADGIVQLWNPATGQAVAVLNGPGGVSGVAFSPDGRLLASADNDGTVRLFSLATGKPVGAPIAADTGPGGGVVAVAFSPDGRLLASADSDNTVRLWNVATGHAVGAPLPGGTGSPQGVLGVAFSPDSKLLASADSDGTVRLWNLATRQPVGAPIAADTDNITSAVAFSPDGKLLASADSDGTVGLWNPATEEPAGAPIGADTGPNGGVNDVAFSPDGTLLASADANGTIGLWKVSLFTHPYASLRTDVGLPTRQEWNQYAPGETPVEMCTEP